MGVTTDGTIMLSTVQDPVASRTMLGAIDAGSNAIRMVVAELTPAGVLNRIEAERLPVRLGHGTFTRGELDPAIIEQAVAAFRHFREVFDRHGVGAYRAVATSALRSAGNGDVLLHRLHHEAGIELEVIDGDEEARLVRKAVVHALGVTAVPRCILDLGGGSLEVNVRTLAPGAASWVGSSLPIGTVRLVELFGLHGAIGDTEAGMIRRYAATVVQSVLPRRLELAVAACCGGNAETLGKLYGDGHPTQPTVDLAVLERGLPELLGLDVDGRMQRFNLRRDRAEVVAVAALVLTTVARQLGVQKLIAPAVGVREAVLLELAEAAAELQLRSVGAQDKALLTSARTFANRVEHDTTHGEQVRRLARALFTQLRDVHQVPEELGVVLEVAALLHDVGEVVHTRGHHKHSEYMIRWGRIAGLEGVNRELCALLARCHRKSPVDARKVIADADLPKDKRLQLRRMTALLRLADGLDSGHRERFADLVASRAGQTIVLDLIARDGPLPDDAQLTRKADMFQEELGHDVRITVARAMTLPELAPSDSVPRLIAEGGGSGATGRPIARKLW